MASVIDIRQSLGGQARISLNNKMRLLGLFHSNMKKANAQRVLFHSCLSQQDCAGRLSANGPVFIYTMRNTFDFIAKLSTAGERENSSHDTIESTWPFMTRPGMRAFVLRSRVSINFLPRSNSPRTRIVETQWAPIQSISHARALWAFNSFNVSWMAYAASMNDYRAERCSCQVSSQMYWSGER
jgi:hypothetical protein